MREVWPWALTAWILGWTAVTMAFFAPAVWMHLLIYGLGLLGAWVLFTTITYMILSARSYSPLMDWLSDYKNQEKNPRQVKGLWESSRLCRRVDALLAGLLSALVIIVVLFINPPTLLG